MTDDTPVRAILTRSSHLIIPINQEKKKKAPNHFRRVNSDDHASSGRGSATSLKQNVSSGLNDDGDSNVIVNVKCSKLPITCKTVNNTDRLVSDVYAVGFRSPDVQVRSDGITNRLMSVDNTNTASNEEQVHEF